MRPTMGSGWSHASRETRGRVVAKPEVPRQIRFALARALTYETLQTRKKKGSQRCAIMKEGKPVIHQARDMSPTQRAAAELLLGRPLDDKESISVQAFEPPPASDQRRREVSAELRRLFSEVDLNLRPATNDEAEEIFTEAMRSSRPAYCTHR